MDVCQAIGMIADAWKDVKQTTVANCWRHVGILQPSGDQGDNADQQNGEDIRSLLGDIDSMTSHLDIDPSERMMAKDYVNVDDNVETEQSLTDDQIVELVSGGTNDAETDEDKPDVDEEPPPPPPTIVEAHMACQLLISFYENEVAEDEYSSKLTEIRKHMRCLSTKKMAVAKQTSITDFFSK